MVKPIEAVARPKGLGLGADPKLVQQMKSGQKDVEDSHAFVKDGYIKVHHGPHRDLYGQVMNNLIYIYITFSIEQ